MTRRLERWGQWRYRNETGTLEFSDRDPFFDISAINSASDVLFQIFKIMRQSWATEIAIKDLLRALDYLLDAENDYQPKTE